MSDTPSGQDVFEVRKIRRLVELMEEHDLAEIDLRQGETRIRLRRAGKVVQVSSGPPSVLPASTSPPAPAPVPSPVVPAAPASPPAEGAEHLVLIRSPMVGTFYSSPDPNSPPYVKVGDHVGPETTVCIIEAMKVFNQIPAEVSGKIVAVLAENGESVEYGQPLFRVDTRG